MGKHSGRQKCVEKSETTIYTDGSKIMGGVGSGFVIYTKTKLHTRITQNLQVNAQFSRRK